MQNHALWRGLVLVLLLALAFPPISHADDKITVRGVVAGFDGNGQSFHLRDLNGTRHRWLVLFRNGKHDRDAKHRLSVGDVVEIKGEVVGRGYLLAQKVRRLGHVGNVGYAAPLGRPGPVLTGPPVVAGPPPFSAPPVARPPVAQGVQFGGSNTIGSLIKTIGVGAAVKIFADPINRFINTLLRNRSAAVQAQTKVVPILSIDIGINSPGGAYIGAAQVSGPAAAVQKTQAVAQIEIDYQRDVRVKVLVPVDNLQPWVAFRRVPGVGVSAIIDLGI